MYFITVVMIKCLVLDSCYYKQLKHVILDFKLTDRNQQSVRMLDPLEGNVNEFCTSEIRAIKCLFLYSYNKTN